MEPAKLEHAAPPPAAAVASETPAAPPGRTRRFSARRIAPYGYLAPTMLLIFVLMIIPIAMVVSYSFKDNVIVEQNPVFAGLANYATVLTDPDFLAVNRHYTTGKSRADTPSVSVRAYSTSICHACSAMREVSDYGGR